MSRITPFTKRVHIDLADGVFTPNKLIDINDIWWPGGMIADLHIMYQKPLDVLDSVIALHPQLIIVHAEADGKFIDLVDIVKSHGIEVGLAILPGTDVLDVKSAITDIDHILIFSGNLGYQGGSQANLSLLAKVSAIKSLKPSIEIGWDGGVNLSNVRQLAEAGVDVINVGGFIQSAQDPAAQYWALRNIIEEPNNA
jgi:ribulose-phosphate 3-epimerase